MLPLRVLVEPQVVQQHVLELAKVEHQTHMMLQARRGPVQLSLWSRLLVKVRGLGQLILSSAAKGIKFFVMHGQNWKKSWRALHFEKPRHCSCVRLLQRRSGSSLRNGLRRATSDLGSLSVSGLSWSLGRYYVHGIFPGLGQGFQSRSLT